MAKASLLTGLSRVGRGRIVPLSGKRFRRRRCGLGLVAARAKSTAGELRSGPSSKPTAFVPPDGRERGVTRREVFASIAARKLWPKPEACPSLSFRATSRCRLAVAAAGRPEADHCTAAAGEIIDSLESPRFASPRRKCRCATTGTGAALASERPCPGALVLEGVLPADAWELTDSSEAASRPSPPGHSDGHSSSRWSRCRKAPCRLSP
jgi:hypothetical protein